MVKLSCLYVLNAHIRRLFVFLAVRQGLLCLIDLKGLWAFLELFHIGRFLFFSIVVFLLIGKNFFFFNQPKFLFFHIGRFLFFRLLSYQKVVFNLYELYVKIYLKMLLILSSLALFFDFFSFFECFFFLHSTVLLFLGGNGEIRNGEIKRFF